MAESKSKTTDSSVETILSRVKKIRASAKIADRSRAKLAESRTQRTAFSSEFKRKISGERDKEGDMDYESLLTKVRDRDKQGNVDYESLLTKVRQKIQSLDKDFFVLLDLMAKTTASEKIIKSKSLKETAAQLKFLRESHESVSHQPQINLSNEEIDSVNKTPIHLHKLFKEEFMSSEDVGPFPEDPGPLNHEEILAELAKDMSEDELCHRFVKHFNIPDQKDHESNNSDAGC